MNKKKLGYQQAYSIKTPGDSKRLYRKWAKTYDKDFALNSNYVSPKKLVLFLINIQKLQIPQFLMWGQVPVYLVNF